MRKPAAFLLLVLLALPAALAAQGASTPEQRKWAVETTRWLEQHPTGDETKARASQLLLWWTEVPDLTLGVCTVMGETKNKKAQAIVVPQAVFSAGAWLIEHPESTHAEQALAGVQGALVAYRTALAADPKVRDPFLDGLVAAESEGKLRETYVDAQIARCEQTENEKKRR